MKLSDYVANRKAASTEAANRMSRRQFWRQKCLLFTACRCPVFPNVSYRCLATTRNTAPCFLGEWGVRISRDEDQWLNEQLILFFARLFNRFGFTTWSIWNGLFSVRLFSFAFLFQCNVEAMRWPFPLLRAGLCEAGRSLLLPTAASYLLISAADKWPDGRDKWWADGR